MSLGALYARSSGTRGAVVGKTSKTVVLPCGVDCIDGSAVAEQATQKAKFARKVHKPPIEAM